MNKEDYVSLEVAKMLKEKEFDYATLYYYEKNGKLGMMNLDAQSQMRKHGYMNDIYPRPTLYEAAKWLRNRYKIHISIDTAMKRWFNLVCNTDDKELYSSKGEYNTYEEALNAGILEALKLI